MPEGEDPDTLVRKGGAAALQPILDDGIDLLERKIQLLERKGWFEGVEHQREALDRLLPTIRAAADPITRDLYLKTVAERTGVSREVLREQAAARAAAPAAPPDAPTPSRGWPVAAVEAPQGGLGGRGRASSPLGTVERPLMDPQGSHRSTCRSGSRLQSCASCTRRCCAVPKTSNRQYSWSSFRPWRRKPLARVDGYEAKYGSPDLDRAFVDACRSLEARPLRKKLG